MKKSLFSTLLLSAVVALFVSSCGDSAAHVNDVIVAKADKVNELMSEATDFLGDEDYEKVKLYLDSISIHVEASKPIISALDNKSAEGLKTATIEYLDICSAGVTELKQAIDVFQSFEGSEGDVDKYNKAVESLNEFIKKADDKLEEAQAAQVEFAKANNITLR